MEETLLKAAISTKGLCKNYGQVQAVKNLNIEVRRGEIYGFLGRNGAGKTTTIRMLLGLVRPSSGSISILGSSLAEDRAGVLSRIGYFVESPVAYGRLTVRENLDIQRRLLGMPTKAVDYIIEKLNLGEYEKRLAGKLSLGNKQRLSLARALLNSPELLILDEPANGLDPAGIVEIRALLRTLADKEGVTIFMSSHLLDEVEQLADRIGIVHQGSLIEEIDAKELASKGRTAIDIETDDAQKTYRVLSEELGLKGVNRIGASGFSVTDSGARPETIARALVGAGVGILRLAPAEEDLEKHFMRLTGGTL